jgi:hypothetical protein
MRDMLRRQAQMAFFELKLLVNNQEKFSAKTSCPICVTIDVST